MNSNLAFNDLFKMFSQKCSKNLISLVPISFSIKHLIWKVFDLDGKVLHLNSMDVEAIQVQPLPILQAPSKQDQNDDSYDVYHNNQVTQLFFGERL